MPSPITMVVKGDRAHTRDRGPSTVARSVRLPACRRRRFRLGHLLSSAAGLCASSPLPPLPPIGLTPLCPPPPPLLSLAVARAGRAGFQLAGEGGGGGRWMEVTHTHTHTHTYTHTVLVSEGRAALVAPAAN